MKDGEESDESDEEEEGGGQPRGEEEAQTDSERKVPDNKTSRISVSTEPGVVVIVVLTVRYA